MDNTEYNNTKIQFGIKYNIKNTFRYFNVRIYLYSFSNSLIYTFLDTGALRTLCPTRLPPDLMSIPIL